MKKGLHFLREIGPRIHEEIMDENVHNLEIRISLCQSIEALRVLGEVAIQQCFALEHYAKITNFRDGYRDFNRTIQTRIDALNAQIQAQAQEERDIEPIK